MELPKKIYYGLKFMDNGKPNLQLRQPYELNGLFYIQYEGIKTGGLVLEGRGETLEIAKQYLYDRLVKDGIIK